MSARLNRNPIRFFSWKGKTFNQVTSSIQKNMPTTNDTKHNLFLPNPLKHYRREIASDPLSTCNSRSSIRIDEFDRPNGTIHHSTATTKNGLVNTIDNQLPNSVYERTGCSDETTDVCFSQANNARRRVRSSGMIKRQFDISKNNDTYCTSSNQYLVSRNRTFQQNQYNYIRQGDASLKPGTNTSQQNIYSANGLNHCKKYFISSQTTFEYQWIDGNYVTVTVPEGNYSVDDLNQLLKSAMDMHFHYFVSVFDNSKLYLLNINYNNTIQKVELQTFLYDPTVITIDKYTVPYRIDIPDKPPYFVVPTVSVVPGFHILANTSVLQNAIGFQAGYYPPVSIGNVGQILMDQSFYSSFTPGIKPLYRPIYYKPNNSQFAQQGGVSASSLITRLKYDAITNNTAAYRNAYGVSVANALAYGGPENGYTTKDKVGYPNKRTPTFSKYTDTMIVCDAKRSIHG